MNFSLNEVEATAKRAARGAGYDWGLAEEAGKATRWLCAGGHDGVAELARLLNLGYGGDRKAHSVRDLQQDWQGADLLCPLCAGSSLSDCATRLLSGPLKMRRVAVPAIILPFAANAARILEMNILVRGKTWSAITDGENLFCPDPIGDIAEWLEVQVQDAAPPQSERRTRAHPDAKSWSVLLALAHKTYAPATEASRLLGAGAGVSDND